MYRLWYFCCKFYLNLLSYFLAGSITIKFEVFSRALDSEPTMGEIIFQLREAIRTGSLVVTSTTGQRLVVDTNSFAWSTSELQTEIGLFKSSIHFQ